MLLQMRAAGITDVVLTVGHLSELLHTFFRDGSQYGLDITYSYEQSPLGTAGPISLVDGLDDTFLVSNGDVLTTLNLRDLIQFHKEQKAVATIASHFRQSKIDLGVIQRNGSCVVTGYVEKPVYDFIVSMGIYIFEPVVKEYIPYNQRLDFPDLVKTLIAAGQKVVAYEFRGYWEDLGRPDDYRRAANDFETMRSQFLPEG
jgi:NDP-sugar pyrophosphorylase family protein